MDAIQRGTKTCLWVGEHKKEGSRARREKDRRLAFDLEYAGKGDCHGSHTLIP